MDAVVREYFWYRKVLGLKPAHAWVSACGWVARGGKL